MVTPALSVAIVEVEARKPVAVDVDGDGKPALSIANVEVVVGEPVTLDVDGDGEVVTNDVVAPALSVANVEVVAIKPVTVDSWAICKLSVGPVTITSTSFLSVAKSLSVT